MTPDFSRSALLLMDLQAGIVSSIAADTAFAERCARAARAARQRGMTVIYVSVRLRDESASVSPNNLIFARYAQTGTLAESNPTTEIHPAVGYEPSTDLLVVKRRVSAFAGSDLEILLRARDIDTLYLAGLATGGVVLSTVRQAADLDYRLFVLSDCCADADPEIHALLMDKVFVRQAGILTLEQFEENALG